MEFHWYPDTQVSLFSVPFRAGTTPHLFLSMGSLSSPSFIEDTVLQMFVILSVWVWISSRIR